MHRTTERFWQKYRKLPSDVRALADKNFKLKNDAKHPSVQLKRVGHFVSARVGLAHRALAVPDGRDLIWVWIGTHDEYQKMIKRG